VLDFCTVSYQNGSMPVSKFLELNGYKQEDCGLVDIPNMPNVFGLYYSEIIPYRGIMNKEDANDVALSAIPKGEQQLALLYFNKNGYSNYCKEYKEYWDWVNKRNESRYESTLNHGKI
jgi:hypothetical protein